MMNQGHTEEERLELIAQHYREILKLIGEDPEREGLKRTPERAAKALLAITEGYWSDPVAIARKAIFEHEGSRIVVVKDIEFYSMCEHHILPFFGHISIGYIPKGKIIGLSKLPRIVECFARRLQVQENLTAQICNFIAAEIPNDGVIVSCRAGHLCMKMRGVEKQDSTTLTYECTGRFADDLGLRAEYFNMLKQS